MAKTRVYELARDLNLTNKILLSKLNDLDIAVKSHMSALDDDVVARVKRQLFGKKEETIEETRIKPTVIRRRKKKRPIEPTPEPTPEHITPEVVEEPAIETPEPTEVVSESETAEKEVPDAVKASVAEKTAPVEEDIDQAPPVAEPVAEAKEEPPPEPKPEKPKKIVKKPKKEESAKIIQLPVKPVVHPPRKNRLEKKNSKPRLNRCRPGKRPSQNPDPLRTKSQPRSPRKRSGRKKAMRLSKIENF